MHVNYDVPVVFIDPVIFDGEADPEEIEIFHNETKVEKFTFHLYLETTKYFDVPHQKVYDFIRKNDPYICADEEGCSNKDPTKGIPTVGHGGNTKAGTMWKKEGEKV